MKNKIIAVILIIIAITMGGFIFLNNKETTEIAEEDERIELYIVGNIIINNPGIKENTWHIVYEDEGAPGLTKEIEIGDGINCIGDEEICLAFLDLNQDITGERVKIGGVEDGKIIVVYEIEFLNRN